MTPERTRLLAEDQALYDQIAAAKARRAEVQAELAKLDAPDPLLIEARKQADKWWPDEGALTGSMDGSMWMERILAALRRGMELAAAPLFPRDAGMADAEIEAMTEGEPPYTASRIKWAIRETLKRALATQENTDD